MLRWVGEWLAKVRLRREAREDIAFISDAGGADNICEVFVNIMTGDAVKFAKFRNGVLPEAEYPMRRTLVSLSAVQSIIKARRDLDDVLDDNAREMIEKRLKCAEEAFLLSYILITDAERESLSQGEVERSRKMALTIMAQTDDPNAAFAVFPERRIVDKRLKKAEEALREYKNIDPFSMPVVVGVEKRPANKTAVKEYFRVR